MAGVANELGVPGASVYRHASGRADLMEGLAYADDVLLIAERPGGPLRL